MPRRLREASGGVIYHVLNRAVGRMKLFEKEGDYLAFEKVLAETHERTAIRILAYCVIMPNHVSPVALAARRWGTLRGHAMVDRRAYTTLALASFHTAGTGPVYQGRFKSFPVHSDEHFLTVARYVERNALRAELVARAQD